MFIAKDLRKAVEIIREDGGEGLTELNLARRAAEFHTGGLDAVFRVPAQGHWQMGRALAALRRLNLYDNRLGEGGRVLSPSVLVALGTHCSQLEHLDLGRNALGSPQLPMELAAVRLSVTHLILDDNDLSAFPLPVLRLQKLRELRLSGNRISEILTAWPGSVQAQRQEQLVRLGIASLSVACATSEEPMLVEGEPTATDAASAAAAATNNDEDGEDEDDEEGGDDLQKEEVHFPDLEVLALDGNNIVEIPASLPLVAPNLRVLLLRQNEIEHLPDELGELRQLEMLTVSSNILEALPESLGNCAKLQSLYANGNCIADVPFSLVDIPTLRKVNLCNNEISVVPPSWTMAWGHPDPETGIFTGASTSPSSSTMVQEELPHVQILANPVLESGAPTVSSLSSGSL